MEHDHEFLYLLKRLNETLRKSNSLWWSFWKGTFYGLGIFMGTAVFTVVVVYGLSKLQGWAFVGEFVTRVLKQAGY